MAGRRKRNSRWGWQRLVWGGAVAGYLMGVNSGSSGTISPRLKHSSQAWRAVTVPPCTLPLWTLAPCTTVTADLQPHLLHCNMPSWRVSCSTRRSLSAGSSGDGGTRRRGIGQCYSPARLNAAASLFCSSARPIRSPLSVKNFSILRLPLRNRAARLAPKASSCTKSVWRLSHSP